MKIRLHEMKVRTKQVVELVEFSSSVTFLYGPIGRGKSSVARLIDYCFGGELERTPAIRREFLSVELHASLGGTTCILERAASDTQMVRVSWQSVNGETESLNAPLDAQDTPIFGDAIFNLSDLLFHLCGAAPIKVRKRSRDLDSTLVRLSFRDIWWYCYLDQTHLDSSFFRLEDPFRGRKSQDAMRFFTGLHSERLSLLETELLRTLDEQRGKREAVTQIRAFMTQFGWGTDLDLEGELATAERLKAASEQARSELEESRRAATHPSDDLRRRLRELGREAESLEVAVREAGDAIAEQSALRAELITAKTKTDRLEQAGRVLDRVEFVRCPQCAADLANREARDDYCRLCCSHMPLALESSSVELEALRRDLNERIDQIADSIARRQRELKKTERRLVESRATKAELDVRLQHELARYDSAFVESIRTAERDIATYSERVRSLHRLRQMPLAIERLEYEAGALQGDIDRIRSDALAERDRLKDADATVKALADEFKGVLLQVGFPGVSNQDSVLIDPRNWEPVVAHDDQSWGFWDTGSGGKKTLFNVCYALALHRLAVLRGMPVPNVLIIDSPTKNISDDENPELVRALYDTLYEIASDLQIQFLLIDSDLVEPRVPLPKMSSRRMAGTPDAPSLISYYSGP